MVASSRTGIGSVISSGCRIDRSFLRVWWVISEKGPKVGILIPRRFGKASERNRVRRRLREFTMGKLRVAAVPVCMVIKVKYHLREGDYLAIRSELEHIMELVLKELRGRADFSY